MQALPSAVETVGRYESTACWGAGVGGSTEMQGEPGVPGLPQSRGGAPREGSAGSEQGQKEGSGTEQRG